VTVSCKEPWRRGGGKEKEGKKKGRENEREEERK